MSKNKELMEMLNDFHRKGIEIIKKIQEEEKRGLQNSDLKKIEELEKTLADIKKAISELKEFI